MLLLKSIRHWRVCKFIPKARIHGVISFNWIDYAIEERWPENQSRSFCFTAFITPLNRQICASEWIRRIFNGVMNTMKRNDRVLIFWSSFLIGIINSVKRNDYTDECRWDELAGSSMAYWVMEERFGGESTKHLGGEFILWPKYYDLQRWPKSVPEY